MYDVTAPLAAALDDEAKRFLADAEARLAETGPGALPTLWPQLARRVGRHPLGGSCATEGEATADLAAWRACDAAGLRLLAAAPPDEATLVDLYLRGDFEEKTTVLRTLAFLPVTPATVRLLGEIQRTNTVVHFEAGALDSNLAVRALRTGGDDAGFTRDDFHRLVLKCAFLDLPAWRMFQALEEATPALTEMLQGYATEREAAGRSVWTDTYRFVGRARAPGTLARLLGGLEHGDDGVRLAAAEGLLALGFSPGAAACLRERLAREPREAIRRVLAKVLAAGP